MNNSNNDGRGSNLTQEDRKKGGENSHGSQNAGSSGSNSSNKQGKGSNLSQEDRKKGGENSHKNN
ncbi:MAG: hypothetical protein H0U75_01230 [Legionella sp.]|nr:hypothetical protein [Legionella sp.]